MRKFGFRVGRTAKGLALGAVATAMTVSTVQCGSSASPQAPPDASAAVETGGGECPSQWPDPVWGTLDFTQAPDSPAAGTSTKELASPYSVFVQGIESDRGVSSKSYADMVARRLKQAGHGGQAQLVLFGGQADLEEPDRFLSHLSSLPADVSLGLLLDSSNREYQSAEGQLDGLHGFQAAVKSASEHRRIDTLVYPGEGGGLSDEDIVKLSGWMPEGVSLTVLGSVGEVTRSPPPHWTGPYAPMAEAHSLFSKPCPGSEQQPKERILVDFPKPDLCNRCACAPAVSQGVYEACKGSPAQAGRILGYLSSLADHGRDGAADRVVYLFPLSPNTHGPTLAGMGWSLDEHHEFVQGFTEMLASDSGVSAPFIVGIQDMPNSYWTSHGW